MCLPSRTLTNTNATHPIDSYLHYHFSLNLFT